MLYSPQYAYIPVAQLSKHGYYTTACLARNHEYAFNITITSVYHNWIFIRSLLFIAMARSVFTLAEALFECT